MNDQQIQRLVAEVIARVAVQLGADGSRGMVIAVLSGATVGFGEAIRQMRLLTLGGYRVALAFSNAAHDLYGETFISQLAGCPHIETVDPGNWLTSLREARAVVVPLLSVNTLSKLALLTPDNLAANIIVHALFMGKPVIVAQNGANPSDPGREKLGFDQANAALRRALRERLRTIQDYGCTLVDISQLKDAVNSLLDGPPVAAVQGGPPGLEPLRQAFSPAQKVITAAEVTHACRSGMDLHIAGDALLTPLARELAARLGVVLRQQ